MMRALAIWLCLGIVSNCALEVSAIAATWGVPAWHDYLHRASSAVATDDPLHKKKLAYSMTAHGEVSPAQESRQEGGNYRHHQRFSGKADCERNNYTKPTLQPGASDSKHWPLSSTDSDLKASFNWRIRLVQPCRTGLQSGHKHKWDLNSVEFYSGNCSNKTLAPLTVYDSRASGTTTMRYNKEMALDNNPRTKWQGTEDDEKQLWLAVRFSTAEAVRCVKFVQCDCVRSARAVALQYIPDEDSEENWLPVPTTDVMNWGEVSTLQVSV